MATTDITVAEAEQIILSHSITPTAQRCALAQAHGKILAEPVMADRDLPPFDRVAMDGIAIRFDTFKAGVRSFAVERVVAAGMPAATLQNTNACIEVMTGALLPCNTDTVVPYEDVKIENGFAHIGHGEIVQGQHIHRQGSDAAKGTTLLFPGQRLSAAEIALLASVGIAHPLVCAPWSAAVVSTGNELVPVEVTPQPFQIRLSNSMALQAALQQNGCEAVDHHLPDDLAMLEAELQKILLAHDFVVLTGGVSKGKFDLVPRALENLGVVRQFHRVGQKPGKPFWFGTWHGKAVFAFPGNPVSTFLCFYRYLKPWLETNRQQSVVPLQAQLAVDFSFSPPLTYFLQVKTRYENGTCYAYPVPGGGSGDFVNLKEVDGFLELPAYQKLFKTGEIFSFIAFRQ